MIEYRVRPIVRYQVTRFHEFGSNGAGCDTLGVFDSEIAAERARTAFQIADTELQESTPCNGDPYVLVKVFANVPEGEVRYASTLIEAQQFLREASAEGKEYRLFYRR